MDNKFDRQFKASSRGRPFISRNEQRFVAGHLQQPRDEFFRRSTRNGNLFHHPGFSAARPSTPEQTRVSKANFENAGVHFSQTGRSCTQSRGFYENRKETFPNAYREDGYQLSMDSAFNQHQPDEYYATQHFFPSQNNGHKDNFKKFNPSKVKAPYISSQDTTTIPRKGFEKLGNILFVVDSSGVYKNVCANHELIQQQLEALKENNHSLNEEKFYFNKQYPSDQRFRSLKSDGAKSLAHATSMNYPKCKQYPRSKDLVQQPSARAAPQITFTKSFNAKNEKFPGTNEKLQPVYGRQGAQSFGGRADKCSFTRFYPKTANTQTDTNKFLGPRYPRKYITDFQSTPEERHNAREMQDFVENKNVKPMEANPIVYNTIRPFTVYNSGCKEYYPKNERTYRPTRNALTTKSKFYGNESRFPRNQQNVDSVNAKPLRKPPLYAAKEYYPTVSFYSNNKSDKEAFNKNQKSSTAPRLLSSSNQNDSEKVFNFTDMSNMISDPPDSKNLKRCITDSSKRDFSNISPIIKSGICTDDQTKQDL